MEASEALGVAAQVAVALAGFAGVVVVFRPASLHEWARIDRFRLRLLLHNSICPLAYALFGMLLLTMKPTPEWIWRTCSLFGLLFQLPGGIIAYQTSRRLGAQEFAGANKILFYSIAVLGTATQVLQIINIALLNQFWPFFLAIVMHLVTGMLQFMRMVLLLPQQGSDRQN
jgi:hypothetical protein